MGRVPGALRVGGRPRARAQRKVRRLRLTAIVAALAACLLVAAAASARVTYRRFVASDEFYVGQALYQTLRGPIGRSYRRVYGEGITMVACDRLDRGRVLNCDDVWVTNRYNYEVRVRLWHLRLITCHGQGGCENDYARVRYRYRASRDGRVLDRRGGIVDIGS